MKKLQQFFIGGIQRKILLVFVVAMVAVVVTFLAVISFQLGRIRSISTDENRSQLQSVREISSFTTTDMIDKNLGYSTRLEAAVADNVFKFLKRQVDQFGTSFIMNRIIWDESSSSGYSSLEEMLPNPNEADTVSLQFIPTENLDMEDPEIFNLAYMMLSSIGIEQMLAIRNGFINSAFIVSPRGFCVIADTDPGNKFDSSGNLIKDDLTQRDWYKGAIEKDGIFFSDVHVDVYAKKLSIVCSYPIRDRDGKVFAVVGMDVFLETLADDIEIESTSDKFIFMLNKDGKVVFSTRGTDLFVQNPTIDSQDLRKLNYPELTTFINEAMAGSEGVYSVQIDDKAYFMTGAMLDTPQWLLVSAIDKVAVETPIIRMEEDFAVISDEASTRFSTILDYSKRTLITLIIIDVLACVSFALFITARIVKPLGMMSKQISKMSGDDLSFEMKPEYETKDEVEVLAKAFSSLSQRTREYIDQITEITAEKERMEAELDVAAKIQADMLPRTFPAYPERGEFDLYASMVPAREVGGDFYDFFMVDDDRIALVMADVSGKGIPAALFMVKAKSLIKNRTMMGGSPSEIIHDVNNQLCEGNDEEFFVTVWLAIINVRTGEGVAVNAGHEHPALKHKDGEFKTIEYPHSTAVAVMEDLKFEEHGFQLKTGDIIFMYTDGVTEATSKDLQLFGTERMVRSLNSCPNDDPRDIIQKVADGISRFVADAEQFDDITMLCFRFDGDDAKMLELDAKRENLDEVLGFVDGYLEAKGCSLKVQMQIDIAVEEIFVNIAHYAYQPDSGKAIIKAGFDEQQRIVSFTFIDSGKPFNPLERKDPDITQKLEDRKIGGLGIYMVKKSMDRVLYEHLDGKNVLTIEKKI